MTAAVDCWPGLVLVVFLTAGTVVAYVRDRRAGY